MAPTETKFRLSRIVVSAAVFISLCVPTAAEVRRCYWCGPLAEQVHRSQRALPCSGPHTQVTICDPGFSYCAVVATSPPYIESRYCVKLYQDECYSLYCNSTRTWRMTCPCRGDLCNGPNTEREEEAFAGLAKLVARTQNTRVRRTLIATSGFISMNTNKKNRIDNATVEENKNIANNTSSNEEPDANNNNNDNQINDTNSTVTTVDANIESQSDTTVSVAPNIKSDENQMIETVTTLSDTTLADLEPKNNEVTTNIPNTDEVIKTNDSQMNETSIQIDIPTVNVESSDLKTEIILMSSETTELVNDIKPSDITNINENIPDIQTTPEIITQAAIELKTTTLTITEPTKTSPAEEKMDENTMKPSEKLPTAEALQHNDTLTTKTTGQTTMRTTVTSNLPILATTEVSKTRNNTAVRLDAQIFTLAIGVILHYV